MKSPHCLNDAPTTPFDVAADLIEPLIHRRMITGTQPINRNPPQATWIRQAESVTGDSQVDPLSPRSLGQIAVNQRIRYYLTRRQQGHRVIRQPIPVPCYDLARFHILRDPVQDIVQHDRQRTREITAIHRSHISTSLDRCGERQMRKKPLRILTQRIETGDR